MHARVVLGVGKCVLFREVSSVQECPHRERGSTVVTTHRCLGCLGCQGRTRRHREVVPSRQLGAYPNHPRNSQTNTPVMRSCDNHVRVM